MRVPEIDTSSRDIIELLPMHRLARFAILLSSIAFAQTPLATVTGLSTDPSGSAVTSATITLTNKDTGVQRTAKTNQTGAYSFPNLPPGVYSLAAEAAGFKKIQVDAFALEAF